MRTEEELIEAYLLGKLQGAEKNDFELRVKQDSTFQKEVEVQKLILTAIRERRKQDLKENLEKSLADENTRMIYRPIWISIAAMVVAITTLSLYFYLKKDSNPNQNETVNITSFEKPQIVEAPPAGRPSFNESEIDSLNSDSLKGLKSVTYSNSLENIESNSYSKMEDISTKSEKDSILSDIMIKDTTMSLLAFAPALNRSSQALQQPVPIEKNKAPENSVKKTVKVSDTLKFQHGSDPIVGHPITIEAGDEDMVVEFWTSPINFKGYKLYRKKLIIYGINTSEKPLLYKDEGIMYLKVNKIVYPLIESNEFNPFVPLKNRELLKKFEE